MKGKFAFLQLEIQFSLGRLQESSRSMDALFKTVQDGNRRLIGEIQSGGDRAAGEAKSAAILTARQSLEQATRRTIFLALAVLVAICASFAYFIRRWIGRPVTAIVDRLSVSADQAASNSSQVSSSSHTLAEGASKQAAAIEETSSSLEEMSAMISKNADYSRQADALMQQTQQIVAEANGSMTNLMGSMTEITRASEETFKIVKTIDEIAFQTNLLALNAAVEAARAGQSGAGFAVVADEVRNLARRAADAAHNTAQLIDATIQKVQTGSKMVGGANDTFAKVAERRDHGDRPDHPARRSRLRRILDGRAGAERAVRGDPVGGGGVEPDRQRCGQDRTGAPGRPAGPRRRSDVADRRGAHAGEKTGVRAAGG